jgi:hypothetical protein
MIYTNSSEYCIPYVDAISLRHSNTLRLGIENQLARKIILSMKLPKSIFYADIFWTSVTLIFFIGGIVASFIWYWWAFIAGLFLSYIVSKANTKSNSENILDVITRDEGYYNRLMRNGFILYSFDDSNSELFEKYKIK